VTQAAMLAIRRINGAGANAGHLRKLILNMVLIRLPLLANLGGVVEFEHKRQFVVVANGANGEHLAATQAAGKRSVHNELAVPGKHVRQNFFYGIVERLVGMVNDLRLAIRHTLYSINRFNFGWCDYVKRVSLANNG